MPGGGAAKLSQPKPQRSGGNARRGGKAAGSGVGAVRKARGGGRNSNMMDIDQGPSGRPVGRFPITTGGKNKKGGKRGGNAAAPAARGAAGGKRGGRAGREGKGKGDQQKKKPVTKESLDMDLDNYMMRDEKTAKTTLDADLESYMLGGASDIPQQIGA